MKLTALVVLATACGQPATKPTVTAPTPPPVAVTAAAPPPVALHAAPTCPLPPLVIEPDPDAPTDGAEGMARLAKPEHGDRCQTADSNLARVEQAIAAGPVKTKALPVKPWDKKTRPRDFALVERRLGLQPDERAILDRNGFVVLARMPGEYANMFHEIYQSQLPIYVSVDAVLDAVYLGNDSLIADLEDKELAPLLGRVIDQLACALPGAAAGYPADTRRDLDLYVAVARALLRGDAPTSMFGDPGVEAEAQRLVASAIAAQEMQKTPLFGRDRMIDFTAYTPRSHYAKTDARKRFFRAGMWLSRLELNLVSRSSRSSQPGTAPDPSETPREDVLALALADLVATSGATADVARLDTAWSLLAGRREDVSVAQLAELRKAATITSLTAPDAAAKLRAAIGDRYKRTARLHYMPEGSSELPAIATLLGPRVVPDAAATRPIVSDEVPGREVLHAADMAYALGHDRALAYLGAERKQFPTLDAQLGKARAIMQQTPRGPDDLYDAWLDAVIGLAKPETGTLPSFTATPAYADRRVESALTAFGQIKHNYVLVAGESYFAGGCEIPDGYVEPATATYEKLLDYIARGERAWPQLDPKDEVGGLAYFKSLQKVLETLLAIQRDELAGRALSADERAFLSMVVEMAPGTTGGPPTYTGWWFDMFRHRELDGRAPSNYIASFFTGSQIAYIGATQPRMGVFVVDSNGPPRLVVGPVSRAYEFQGPQAKRLSDEDGANLSEAQRVTPWEASYTGGSALPDPKFGVKWSPGSDIEIQAHDALGKIVIELVDHHRVAIQKVTVDVKPGKTKVPVKLKKGRVAEGLHLMVGKWSAWEEIGVVEGSVYAGFGGFELSYD